MKLFSQVGSAASASVQVALNLKSISYENVVIDSDVARASGLPEPMAAAVPALAPVLLDQRRTFIETLTIIEYLDESYPQPPLLPGTARDRAQIRALAELIVSQLHPPISLRARDCLERAKVAREQWQDKWVHDGLNLLENVLNSNTARGKFSHGDAPTLADVCLVPEIWFAQRLGAELPCYPAIECTYQHCMELDAFKRVASILA